MPALHVKRKCFEDTGEVLSYKKNPTVFYYRELIKGARSYRSEKIEGADARMKKRMRSLSRKSFVDPGQRR